MSSLWTPSGEHRVPDRRERAAEASGTTSSAGGASAGDEGPKAAGRLDAEAEAGAGPASREEASAEFARLEQELLSVPAAEVIANHCYGLFELAALHLGRPSPNFEQARLAIDALAAIVEGLGDRLGEPAATLREGLSQIRLGFVKLNSGDAPPPPGR